MTQGVEVPANHWLSRVVRERGMPAQSRIVLHYYRTRSFALQTSIVDDTLPFSVAQLRRQHYMISNKHNEIII